MRQVCIYILLHTILINCSGQIKQSGLSMPFSSGADTISIEKLGIVRDSESGIVIEKDLDLQGGVLLLPENSNLIIRGG